MPSFVSIQDPYWDDSEYLLDSTVNASRDADEGGAAYAFASAGGVKLLFDNPDFRTYLARGTFHVLVGMDAVTNTAAIGELRRIAEQFPTFTCRAFVSRSNDGTFHPKVSWFYKNERAAMLVGSGNLTAGGLRGNHEAFASLQMSAAEARAWRRTWSLWMDRHSADLHSLDSTIVRDQAAQNDRDSRPLPRRREPIEVGPNGGLHVGRLEGSDASALIAEVPRGAERWGQGNFDLETFTTFFGATPSVSRVIILSHVSLDGHSDPIEERPSIASSSHNYRFELSATRGMSYPERGRPTALFVRIAARTFRYRLFMPGQREHDEISRFLDREAGPQGRRMRRLRTEWALIRRARFARRLVN